MSYDVDLVINTGIDEYPVLEIGNYTSNVAQIFLFGLGDYLREFNGKKASECIPVFEEAIARLEDPKNRVQLKKLEPKNGWGDLEGASDFLRKILQGCKDHPATTVRVY